MKGQLCSGPDITISIIRPYHWAFWRATASCFIIYLANILDLYWGLGLKHVDAVEWPKPKSVGFLVRQPDFRTAYLQVETIKESSMTGGPATKAVAGRTQVGVGGGGEAEVAEVEIQIQIHDFRKVQKAGLRIGLLTSKAKFQCYDTSFWKLIVFFSLMLER